MRPSPAPLPPDPFWLDFTGFVPLPPAREWDDFIGYVPGAGAENVVSSQKAEGRAAEKVVRRQ
ncbi:MAG TPA: hypothetical protein VFV54_06900 [Thermoanaerobaculia bacterium]|nr:hypothetical protein [Thermoanaerobaculia bacterium]